MTAVSSVLTPVYPGTKQDCFACGGYSHRYEPQPSKQGRLSNHVYVHVLWMVASYTLFITTTYDTRTLFFLL